MEHILMIRVKVYGPSASDVFGVDIHEVLTVQNVSDVDGVLIITSAPVPERPHPHRNGETIPALKFRQTVYPRGGWTKMILEHPDQEA